MPVRHSVKTDPVFSLWLKTISVAPSSRLCSELDENDVSAFMGYPSKQGVASTLFGSPSSLGSDIPPAFQIGDIFDLKKSNPSLRLAMKVE